MHTDLQLQSYLSENKMTETFIKYFCEVWQSLLSKVNYDVFKDHICFLGIELMNLALLHG